MSGPGPNDPIADGASPDGLPPLREVIRALDLRAKKSLGQNFIQDLNLTRRIARLALTGSAAQAPYALPGSAAQAPYALLGSAAQAPYALPGSAAQAPYAGPLDGVTVIEVGPGPGGLTRALLLEGAAHVVAVERDERCLPALADIGRRYPGRLTVLADDALSVDWPAALAGVPGHETGAGRDVRIVANLPYGIATRLLIGWLETAPWPPWFSRLTLMFQKEVAERIVAAPGTKPYGRLSVIAQWRATCRIVMTLGPSAFTPPPKVESAVVELIPRVAMEPACDVRTLGRVTAAAFGQRRKMLRSTLKPVCPDPEALLARLGIAGDRRAETLSIAELASIAKALDERSP